MSANFFAIVPRSRIERRQPGKGIPAGHDQRNKSEGKTKKQVLGYYEDAGWMQRRREVERLAQNRQDWRCIVAKVNNKLFPGTF